MDATLLLAPGSNAAGATRTGTAFRVPNYHAATLQIRLLNGATGPSVAGYIALQMSHDNATWREVSRVTHNTTNNAEVISITTPILGAFIRAVQSGNTAQAVTGEAILHLSRV